MLSHWASGFQLLKVRNKWHNQAKSTFRQGYPGAAQQGSRSNTHMFHAPLCGFFQVFIDLLLLFSLVFLSFLFCLSLYFPDVLPQMHYAFMRNTGCTIPERAVHTYMRTTPYPWKRNTHCYTRSIPPNSNLPRNPLLSLLLTPSNEIVTPTPQGGTH